MKNWTWNNGQKSRGRQPRCIIVAPTGEVHRFTGADIAGVVKVLGSDYTKQGKWSNSTYRCISPDGAVEVSWYQDWDTGETFPQDTWSDAYSWLIERAPRADYDSFMAYVRENFPKVANKFDTNAVAIAEFENISDTTEITINFGNPTNRQIRDGWWDAPKSQDGVTIAPSEDTGWYNPVIVEPKNAVILSSVHRRGMHGGYYSVKVVLK